MSNEGRSPKGRGPQHTTHHDDCGCLSARYEARLDAQRAATASLEALNRKHAEMYAKEIDRHEAQIAALKHDEATLLEDNDYLRQRIATLEAELAEALGEEQAARNRATASQAHANDLRDALEKVHKFLLAEYGYSSGEALFRGEIIEAGARPTWETVCDALAQTPAASLAAHDAEVLERAVHAIEDIDVDANPQLNDAHTMWGACADCVRALAAQAQAQEVKP